MTFPRFCFTDSVARVLSAALLLAVAAPSTSVPAAAQMVGDTAAPPRMTWDPNDPRVGLSAGWLDAGEAIWNMEHLAFIPRPEGFFNPETPGDGRFSNTDLAFRDDLLIQGNYNGFQILDISTPSEPRVRVSVVCPGG